MFLFLPSLANRPYRLCHDALSFKLKIGEFFAHDNQKSRATAKKVFVDLKRCFMDSSIKFRMITAMCLDGFRLFYADEIFQVSCNLFTRGIWHVTQREKLSFGVITCWLLTVEVKGE